MGEIIEFQGNCFKMKNKRIKKLKKKHFGIVACKLRVIKAPEKDVHVRGFG